MESIPIKKLNENGLPMWLTFNVGMKNLLQGNYGWRINSTAVQI
jgi:hypothetical protein